MTKRLSKESDKKLILLMWLTSLLLLVLVVAVLVKINNTHTDKKSRVGETSFREKYTKVPADHIYQTIDADATRKMLHEGTGVLFLGFPACPWCQSLSPYLNEVAKEKGVEKIAYFDIRQDRTDNTGAYQDVVSVLGPYLEKDEDGNPRVYVPQVVIMKDGKVVGSYRIELPDEEGLTPDTYWNEKNIEKAKDQIRVELKKLQ